MQDFEVSVIGHDNRTYSLAEVERARARAARGDKEALAVIASINATRVPDLMQILHDCPECRAAMERGEQPTIMSADDLFDLEPTRKHKKLFPRRPRWR